MLRPLFIRSLDQFDLARHPGLVQPRLKRAVHAQDDEPALFRNGLDPVALLTLGGLGSEIDVLGSVSVLLHVLIVAVERRERLIGLQHGPRLRYHRLSLTRNP